jgi:hypothetical protein
MTTNECVQRVLVRAAATILLSLTAACGYAVGPAGWADAGMHSDPGVSPIGSARLAPERGAARTRSDDVAPYDCYWNGPMYGAAHGALVGVRVGPDNRVVRRLWALAGGAIPCSLGAEPLP